MSLAYKRRKAAIAAEKRRLGVNSISLTRFRFMQSGWSRKITGPPIGTLQDLMDRPENKRLLKMAQEPCPLA